MKKNKVLNIRGALLDKNQLSNYIEKAAAEHNIKNNSNNRNNVIIMHNSIQNAITKVLIIPYSSIKAINISVCAYE